MFDKKKRTAKRPTEALIFYSNNDLYYNSYLIEALDASSMRCLHYILKKTNNTKTQFQISYKELRLGAEVSCDNYVQKALKTLQRLKLIKIRKINRALMIKVLKTAKRLNTKKIA